MTVLEAARYTLQDWSSSKVWLKPSLAYSPNFTLLSSSVSPALCGNTLEMFNVAAL